MDSFSEAATYATFFAEHPANTNPSGPVLEKHITAIENFAAEIRAALVKYQLPDTEINRSRLLMMAFLVPTGSIADRVRRASRFYSDSGLKDMGGW